MEVDDITEKSASCSCCLLLHHPQRRTADKQNGQKRQALPQTFCWTINNSYTFFWAFFRMFHHKINTVKVQMFPYASANNDKIFQKKKN